MSHLNKKSVWRKSRWSLAVTGLHPSKTNSVSLSEDSPTSSRPQAHPPPPRPSGPRWPPRSRHPRPIADSLSRWLTDPQCRPHWRLKRWEIGIWVLLLCVFCLADSVIHAVIFLILFLLISQIFSQIDLCFFHIKFLFSPTLLTKQNVLWF